MLLLLLLVLLVLAIGGGIVISKFLFLILIVVAGQHPHGRHHSADRRDRRLRDFSLLLVELGRLRPWNGESRQHNRYPRAAHGATGLGEWLLTEFAARTPLDRHAFRFQHSRRVLTHGHH